MDIKEWVWRTEQASKNNILLYGKDGRSGLLGGKTKWKSVETLASETGLTIEATEDLMRELYNAGKLIEKDSLWCYCEVKC